MTETTGPATLADVKKGDTVWVFPYGEYSGYREIVIERLTQTQIIIGSRKFWRTNGKYGDRIGEEVAGRHDWRSACILVGARADTKKLERDKEKARLALRSQWCDSTRQPHCHQENVVEMRVACDAAEIALRELGEWEDKP